MKNRFWGEFFHKKEIAINRDSYLSTIHQSSLKMFLCRNNLTKNESKKKYSTVFNPSDCVCFGAPLFPKDSPEWNSH